jgi:hypothetical protein
MGRPYPNRRRKRPGRPPPHQYRGEDPPVRPQSYQDFGFRHLYNVFMPGIRGRERREFFNGATDWTVLVMGLFGAVVGSAMAGLVGAIVGFLAGLSFMAYMMQKHGYYRP